MTYSTGLVVARARPLLSCAAFAVAVILLAPLIAVIPMGFTGTRSLRFPPRGWSLRWYREFFTSNEWVGSFANSLAIALAVTALAVLVGGLAALALTRPPAQVRAAGRTPIHAEAVMRVLFLSPLIVPVVVTGVGTYAVFLQWRLVGSMWGFLFAHTALAAPYVLITVSSALQTMNWDLVRAAHSLGATPWRAFHRVTLPHLSGGISTGALFAFITSFDETVVSLFLSSSELRTLPVQMYASVTRDTDPTIATASSLMLVLTTALLLIALRRKPA